MSRLQQHLQRRRHATNASKTILREVQRFPRLLGQVDTKKDGRIIDIVTPGQL